MVFNGLGRARGEERTDSPGHAASFPTLCIRRSVLSVDDHYAIGHQIRDSGLGEH